MGWILAEINGQLEIVDAGPNDGFAHFVDAQNAHDKAHEMRLKCLNRVKHLAEYHARRESLSAAEQAALAEPLELPATPACPPTTPEQSQGRS